MIRDAAQRGVPEAQLLYGQMLLDGRDVEANPRQALYWFERAAISGNVMAMNMVGRCLDQGWGIRASARMAEPWFRAAAERGLDWGMYNLATLLTLGNGVPQDRRAALYWFRKAAALGHAKSLNIVGGFYEDGWEVTRDLAMAREYYRQAALAGDFRGQFNYARFLVGEGRIDDALHWVARVPDTATPAFVRKMATYLARCGYPALEHYGRHLESLPASTTRSSTPEVVHGALPEGTLPADV